MPLIAAIAICSAVGRRLGGQWNTSHQFARQKLHILAGIEQRQVGDHFEATLRGGRITRASLVEDELRDEKIELVSTLVPPLARDFLMSRANQIATRPRRQVTWDRCFQIDARLHAVDDL